MARLITRSISIHAPTRGATRSRKNGSGQRRISIHAPTRGATLCAFPLPDPYIFQSTLPRGERLVSSWDTLITSVHFNPRSHEGSDAELRNNPVHLRNFNPRSHEGSDNTFTNGNPIRIQFQSTLPRGERRYYQVPTAPVPAISIHAPTRGATKVIYSQSFICTISIHAPTRGATDMPLLTVTALAISIHAPTRGATESEVV